MRKECMLFGLNMGFSEEHRNTLLKRREVALAFESSGNPGSAAAVKAVADEAKVGEDQVVVQRIRSEFGKPEFVVEALVYDSVADREKAAEGMKLGKKAAEKLKKAEGEGGGSAEGASDNPEQPGGGGGAGEGDSKKEGQPGGDSGAGREKKEEVKDEKAEEKPAADAGEGEKKEDAKEEKKGGAKE